MNFINYVEDLRRHLTNFTYVEYLWDTIRSRECVAFVTLEEEEIYEQHIPLDFKNFLKNCVTKLRALSNSKSKVAWKHLDLKYICTLIYYALDQDDAPMENGLYAANLFFLLNLLNIPNKKFFYEPIYIKILDVLEEYRKTQDLSNRAIMFTMDDLKIFLTKHSLKDYLKETIAVLLEYSYLNSDQFEHINLDISYENLGYIAFVTLKILTEQIAQRSNKEETLSYLLLGLLSNLRSNHTRHFPSNIVVAHKHNVRLFIVENYSKFATQNLSFVVEVMKGILLNPKFDDLEGAACLIEELPLTGYEAILNIYIKGLQSNPKFISHLVKYLVPFIKHPSPHESQEKRVLRMKVFLNILLEYLLQFFVTEGEKVIVILSECSELPLGIKALIEVWKMWDDKGELMPLMEILYRITDPTWHKNIANIAYVTLLCNLIVASPAIFKLRVLNQFRTLSIKGSPLDLKQCIGHLKRVLLNHSKGPHLTMYFLDIFIKLMLHSQESSSQFGKELYELIIPNLTTTQHAYTWSIVDCLFSSCFLTKPIFSKFHSLDLLKTDHIKILLEHKTITSNHRSSASKLLLGMLNHVPYTETIALDQILDTWASNVCPFEKDFNATLQCLVKILEQKTHCTEAERERYMRLQLIVYRLFYNQMFPNESVVCAIQLLKEYARLLGEGQQYSNAVFSHTEESLNTKLALVCEMEYVNPKILMKDVSYIVKFYAYGREAVGEFTVAQLQKIVDVMKYSPELKEYLWSHQEILQMAVILYTNICLIDPPMVPPCVRCLENVSKMANLTDPLKLQIMFSLYDVCNLHLHYFEPLIPFLFESLYSKTQYLRFHAMNIIKNLISNQQLHLVDGQYFLFMSLLADKNVLINQHMEMFVEENFVPVHHEIVATHFVPGIIQYNHYYEHPAISLTLAEQQILTHAKYDFHDRCCIHYHLYRTLPPNLKYNILKEISLEILTRISTKSLEMSKELMCILEDALVVILFTIPTHKSYNDMKSFFTVGLETIRIDLLGKYLTEDFKIKIEPLENNTTVSTKPKLFQDYQLTLGIILTPLFHILYSDLNRNAKLCQNILFTIISLSENFYDIRYLISEDATLRSLYQQLEPFYSRMEHQFTFNQLSVNPAHFKLLSKKNSREFYLHETTNLCSIPEGVINSFNIPRI